MTAERNESRHRQATPHAPLDGGVRSHHGSLRSKLVLSLAAMFFVFMTIDEMVRQQVIKPEFAALERAGAIRDANRVMAAIHANMDHLSDLAEHWAGALGHQSRSLDSQDPQTGPAKVLPRGSTGPERENLEWAAALQKDDSWSWLQRNRQSDSLERQKSDLTTLADLCWKSDSPTFRGMTRTADNSLVMFAAVKTQPSEPASDDDSQWLIVGRTIDQAMIASLRKQTQVDFSLQSMRTARPKQELTVWEADDSILVVEFQLSGVDNQQLANLYVQVPREISAHSSHTTSMARNSFIFGSVGALLLLLLLLQRIVIGPLTAIREHSDRVAEQGFDTEPLVLPSNDEIGELAGAFDHMMIRLSNAQTQLTEASRAAGRSQVASTVIHNVGNVLTNVNSLLDVAAGQVDGLRIEPLSKLAERLRHADKEEALVAATPDYLEGLAASLDSDREMISQLISTLHDNVRHIHDVIRDQQHHAAHEVGSSVVSLRDVVNEAIGCCRAGLDENSVEVEVTGELNTEVRSDRSLLLQSLINVIGNGRHALREIDGPRRLQIHAEWGSSSASVHVRDNGIGMTEETLGKVFDAHFTTKETGSGLGLHFCAITLQRLGGTIRAESDGPGQGSTFVIELPLAAKVQRKSRGNVGYEMAGARS